MATVVRFAVGGKLKRGRTVKSAKSSRFLVMADLADVAPEHRSILDDHRRYLLYKDPYFRIGRRKTLATAVASSLKVAELAKDLHPDISSSISQMLEVKEVGKWVPRGLVLSVTSHFLERPSIERKPRDERGPRYRDGPRHKYFGSPSKNTLMHIINYLPLDKETLRPEDIPHMGLSAEALHVSIRFREPPKCS